MGGEGATGGLGERELADLAGVPVTFVRRAAELGILRPADGRPSYANRTSAASAWRRPATTPGCRWTASGRPWPRVAWPSISWTARSTGFAAHTGQTYRQLCDERGLDLEILRRLQEARGFPPLGPDDLVRQDDLPMIGAFQISMMFGVRPSRWCG
jgi:hypothetical protein